MIAKNIKEDPKPFYQHAKEKLKYKNEMEATALLNEHFPSVFTEANPINIETDRRESSQPSELPTLNKEILERHPTYLKEAKSTGVNYLPPILLRKTAKVIAGPYTKIFRESPIYGQNANNNIKTAPKTSPSN